MPDITKVMKVISKGHDYYGKATDTISRVKKIRDAANLDPTNPEELKRFVGIADKETTKVLNLLSKRATEAEKAANSNAKFPAIASRTVKMWSKWTAAIYKHGNDSKQALAARDGYLRALMDYDLALRERIALCEIYIKQSTQQEKAYKTVVSIHEAAEKYCLAVIRFPSGTSTAPQVEAMQTLLKFQGVRAPANRLHKAHAKIVKKAKAEKKRVEGIKAANDPWIADLQARNLGRVVKKALAALGL